jgi:TP901 family phage tail tape measure protein
MDKTVYTESVVTLNATQAQNVLESLKGKAKELRGALLAATQSGDTSKIKTIEQQLKGVESAQRNVRKETYDYNSVLKNLDGSTLNQLTASARTLRSQMRNLVVGTKEYEAASRDLTKVNVRINDIKASQRALNTSLDNGVTLWNRWMGVAALAAAGAYAKKAAEEAARLDDTYSDVMKTTGLTRDEVVKLNEAFQKMDTRTSRDALNKLARDAGKLGISGTENVLAFVKAANQIDVALGEDLGEGAIRNIAKIADVLGDTGKLGLEKALLSVGSTINALGQASTANEQYIVDFTQRLAGIGAQAGIATADIMGFASAMDQSGVKVEMGATAFQKFVMQMYLKTATFADMAGMKVETFSKLLKEDANKAILTVLTSLNKAGGFEKLAPIFKDLGTDGARAVSALAALASNITAVTEAQQLANVEFKKATSLTNEYDIKNNNFQAELEKSQKRLKDAALLLGERLMPVYQTLTSGLAGTATMLSKLNVGVLVPLLASLALLVTRTRLVAAAQTLANNAVKVWNVIAATGRSVALLFSAAYNAIIGNAGRSAAAMRLFNNTVNASVIGLAVTAVTLLSAAIYKLSTSQSAAGKAMRDFNVEAGKQKQEANDLLDILAQQTEGSDLYNDALGRLKEKYGTYLGDLIDEKGRLTDVAKAREVLNRRIDETVAARIKEEALTDRTASYVKKEVDQTSALASWIAQLKNIDDAAASAYAQNIVKRLKAGEGARDVFASYFTFTEEWAGSTQQKVYDLMDGIKRNYTKFSSDMSAINRQFAGFLPKDTAQKTEKEGLQAAQAVTDSASETVNSLTKAYQAADKVAETRHKEEINDLKRQLLDKKITQEDYQKESEALNIKFLTKRNELAKKYGQDNADIEGQLLDAQIQQQKGAMTSLADMAKMLKSQNGGFSIKSLLSDSEKGIKDFMKDADDDVKASVEGLFDELDGDISSSMDVVNGILANHIDVQYELVDEKLYQEGLLNLKLEKLGKYAQIAQNIASTLASVVEGFQQSELDSLEAEKDAELSLYSDDSDKRQDIENEYQAKELAVKKKYADVDMAVKIAQAIASGAVAAIQAYAQGGPYAGPALAAIVAAVTAANVMLIIKQRNSLLSTQAASSSSSSSSAGRVVSGYSSGGYTGLDESDTQPAGIVHSNEWVAPAWMVRAQPATFASLEAARMAGGHSITTPRHFASGGYTSAAGGGSNLDPALVMKLANAIDKLSNTPLKAYTLLSDQDKQRSLRDRMKKATSR